MADTFCTHIAVAHPNPQTPKEYLDNVELVITHLLALFAAINAITDDVASLAMLGVDLCSELSARVALLYRHPEPAQTDEVTTGQ